jgi:hypothetical protein
MIRKLWLAFGICLITSSIAFSLGVDETNFIQSPIAQGQSLAERVALSHMHGHDFELAVRRHSKTRYDFTDGEETLAQVTPPPYPLTINFSYGATYGQPILPNSVIGIGCPYSPSGSITGGTFNTCSMDSAGNIRVTGTLSGNVTIALGTPLPVQVQNSPLPVSSPGLALLTVIANASGAPESTIPVTTAAPCTTSTCSSLAANEALTGNGFTHYPATSVTSATAAQIGSGALTIAGLSITWSAPTTTAGCWFTLYNNASSPTVGTSFISQFYLNTAVPGQLALPIPTTVGGKIASGLWYAVTTTPTGSTACNTTANELWVEAWYV